MKSLAELQAIKEKMRDKVILREGLNSVRVVVGMATCGIAAGARPVLNALVEGVNKEGLTEKVTVSQTGCIGICQLEPIVEVFEPATVLPAVLRDAPYGYRRYCCFRIFPHIFLRFDGVKTPQGLLFFLSRCKV